MSTETTTKFSFRTPANIQDFANDPLKQQGMDQLWSQNLDGFTQQGMQSNQWNTTNTPETTNYYNPIDKNPPSNAAPVNWSAFPGRLAYNFPSATQDQLDEMADTGVMPNGINSDPCNTSQGSTVPYFPYGPRGWQDEYCEWAVTRDTNGNIIRVDFTCENPEYWNSLWLIDPNKVLELYQSILDKPQITLDDLSISGVTNPITGQPVYNPLNIWNNGPVSDSSKGGAIHLTSTPNTLQTEIGLATAATVLRNNPSGTTGNTTWPSSQYNELLCDAQYGQKNRNSDPNIGGAVNQLLANQGFVATLADPPGLYIQMPDFSNYKTPDGTSASTFWNIVRGSETLQSQDGKALPGNFILHAVFEVPSSKGYTVSDITIGGKNINWGSQIADTFRMQIVASAFQGTKPQGYDAVGDQANPLAQPLQLFYESVYTSMYTVLVPNPMQHPISLLSNSTFIPPQVMIGATRVNMVITSDTCTAKSNQPGTYPSISFDDPAITATVTSVEENITYAVPGNSAPGQYTALYLTVNVGENATAGVKNVYVTNVGQQQGPPMKALLNVIPVTVQAAVKWQNTGIEVSTANTVKIGYESGLWTANPNDNGGQLYDAAGNPRGIPAKPGYTMPGQNEGALIGRIGASVFFVGDGVTAPASLSGDLELCINDDLNAQYGAGFADNKGAVVVKVSIS